MRSARPSSLVRGDIVSSTRPTQNKSCSLLPVKVSVHDENKIRTSCTHSGALQHAHSCHKQRLGASGEDKRPYEPFASFACCEKRNFFAQETSFLGVASNNRTIPLAEIGSKANYHEMGNIVKQVLGLHSEAGPWPLSDSAFSQ